MCLDRLGIERVPEVMRAGLCVLDHNKVKSDFEEGKVLDLCTGKNGICSKNFYCSYLFFCRQRHKTAGHDVLHYNKCGGKKRLFKPLAFLHCVSLARLSLM